MPYLKAGYQTFILRYSVREDAAWPTPLDDYEQAMELIRSKAEDWNLYPDKIAVIGFSAGAAACAEQASNSAAVPTIRRGDMAYSGKCVEPAPGRWPRQRATSHGR